MSKRLGYTFYPKDWRSDDKVIMLNAEERDMFRFFIDECHIKSSAKLEWNLGYLRRILGHNKQKVERIFKVLCSFELVYREGDYIVVPSVINRLGFIEEQSDRGKLGGSAKSNILAKEKEKEKQKQKQKEKVEYTHDGSDDLKQSLIDKPHLRNGFNAKINKETQFTKLDFIEWFNSCLNHIGLNGSIKSLSKEGNDNFNALIESGYTIKDFKIAFSNFHTNDHYKNKGFIAYKYFLEQGTFERFLSMGGKESTSLQTEYQRIQQKQKELMRKAKAGEI